MKKEETIKELRRLQEFLLDHEIYGIACNIGEAMIYVNQAYDEEQPYLEEK